MKSLWKIGIPLLALVSSAAQAEGLQIVIANDDGLSSNVKALYTALKAAGHDVIVSIPCRGQSGMGAAIKFERPIVPLAEDCLNGLAKAGEPGAGRATKAGYAPDWHYVDGTPVMALLYGLDILAQERWGRMPDLILSGPNEGQNVGRISVSSGTVGNAQYGAMRNIPSIAISAGYDTVDNVNLANPKSTAVARRFIELVALLERQAKGGRLLPAGLALNVNFPTDLDGATWKMARIGNYDHYTVRFENGSGVSSASPTAGSDSPSLPAIAVDVVKDEPTADQAGDESAVFRKDIAVSVMQVAFDAGHTDQQRVAAALEDLVGGKSGTDATGGDAIIR